VRALELYARAQLAVREQPGQEGREQAIDLLARALEADPGFAVAQYALGRVHQTLGNRWKANAQFRAAIQLDASYPEPHKALGDLFMSAPRSADQAVEAYERAIQRRPFYADAHVGLGEARLAKGDVDGAIGAYTRALAHNPIDPRPHISLGKIYYAEKSLYYESVKAYRKAIDLDPRSVEAHMGLGEVYEDKGLYPEAAVEYRRVIELDPKHTGALYNLALVYEKTDPREAIAQWERYIALAAPLPAEKDWVVVARQHLRKLKSQIK
jgi:tetratricopeptide (TPR) repeat protein